ncbi:MAG: hypothetical protein IH991_20640 [Planctomycetes bacterium]|nr:hypothetical protein [Planctomycetota bacterium]
MADRHGLPTFRPCRGWSPTPSGNAARDLSRGSGDKFVVRAVNVSIAGKMATHAGEAPAGAVHDVCFLIAAQLRTRADEFVMARIAGTTKRIGLALECEDHEKHVFEVGYSVRLPRRDVGAH